MKNKKIVTILLIILGILMLAVLGFIISSNVIKNSENEEVSVDNNESIIVEDSENEVLTEEVEEEQGEKYERVVLTSKIGSEVLSKFCISNIYSSTLYDELDKNGFSDDAKLIFTYITITNNYEYHNMIKNSDELGDYITKGDFEIVYKKLFGASSVINHKSVITEDLYDSENNCYKYLTFGYGGIDFDFVIEIPFEIKEYEDRIESSFYKIYAKASSSVTEEGIAKQNVSLYSDVTRINEIYSSDDDRLQDNDSQQSYIKELIDNGTISKENIQIKTYILKEEGDSYYINDLKK